MKEVTVKAGAEVTAAEQAALMAEFGAPEISSSDIIIPKLLLMQGQSKAVSEGSAKFGDLMNTLTNSVVAEAGVSTVELIPFFMDKTYVVSKWTGKRFEFDRIEECNSTNETRPWEEVIDGVKTSFVKSMNYYCLDPKNLAVPIICSFKSTSIKEGKKLATMMYMTNHAEGKVPCGYTIKVGANKVTKEGNTFAVLETTKGRLTTMPEIQECIKWLRTVKAGETKVDNSDLKQADTAPTDTKF